jgi:hypothetical protein
MAHGAILRFVAKAEKCPCFGHKKPLIWTAAGPHSIAQAHHPEISAYCVFRRHNDILSEEVTPVNNGDG